MKNKHWHIIVMLVEIIYILIMTNTPAVNDDPPDTKYLYYPLGIDGVTLKSSLLPPER